jgi:hypothetical protein
MSRLKSQIVTSKSVIPRERIESRILLLRGQKVMLDADLAELYGVETKELNLAVRRNAERFPEDFMFQLSEGEFNNLRFQSVTSRSWGGRRYRPYAFTEQAWPCSPAFFAVRALFKSTSPSCAPLSS